MVTESNEGLLSLIASSLDEVSNQLFLLGFGQELDVVNESAVQIPYFVVASAPIQCEALLYCLVELLQNEL